MGFIVEKRSVVVADSGPDTVCFMVSLRFTDVVENLKKRNPDVTPPGFCVLRIEPLCVAPSLTRACHRRLRPPRSAWQRWRQTIQNVARTNAYRWPLALQLGFKGRSFNGQPVEQFDVWQKRRPKRPVKFMAGRNDPIRRVFQWAN